MAKREADVDKVVRRIITHTAPHLDELVAYWLLVRWGEKHFPGISSVPVEVWRKGGTTSDGRSFEAWEDDGAMFIGIGGGQFDEHPLNGVNDRAGECAATLVAQRLGIRDEPALKPILDFVQRIDAKGGANPWDISAMVKTMNEGGMVELPQLLQWVCLALDAKYSEQARFIAAMADAANSRRDQIFLPDGSSLRIATVESTSPQTHKALFNQGASVVVLRNPETGNVAIFTQKRDQVKLKNVVRVIRLLEQRARRDVQVTNWDELVAPGTISAVRCWYYLEEGQMLLNGSTSCPDVPPTRLSLETIRQVVLLALDPTALICPRLNVCVGNKCKWYPFGLSQCQTLRYNMSHA